MPDAPLHEEREFLRAERLSLSFGGVRAVSDVSFSIRRGVVCAIIGPNGAGKSSVLNLLSGIYRPDSGRLNVDGTWYTHVSPAAASRLGIGRTFQNLALSKSMTVLESIMLGETHAARSTLIEQAFGLPRARHEEARLRARAEDVIAALNLQTVRATTIGKLPYGVQKRVELGRALASRPRLLLLDEPMAGMNAAEKADMCRFILEANAETGATIILIEHDIGVVMDLSEHIIVLDHGEKIADGTADAVRHDPRVIDAYLGAHAADPVA